MPGFDAVQLALQCGVSFGFCLLLWLAGSIVAAFFNIAGDEKDNGYAGVFYRMLAGIIGIVTVYAIYKTSFKTIYILIIPAVFFFLRKKGAGAGSPRILASPSLRIIAEAFFLCLLFCLLFNFLPESEYKQKDSFFYLKIAEALNRTGQENLHQYYNLLDTRYHGVETYHYTELWLNAFQLNLVGKLLPGIQIFRIITYTPLAVAFVFGLFYFYRVLTGAAPRAAGKLVCLCFVFFIPDLYPFLPAIVKKYLLFNFESNFLERPNFRLIYLFLLPVAAGIFQRVFDRRLLFFLLCLCLLQPLVFLAGVPAVLLFFILCRKTSYFGQGTGLSSGDMAVFFSILTLYPVFYFIFSVKAVPVLYHTNLQTVLRFYERSYKYVGLTIVTSLCYTGLLCMAGWLIFRIPTKKESAGYYRENRPFILFMAMITGSSIVIARLFDFMENFYQVAFVGYIVAALFLFSLLAMLSARGILPAIVVIFLQLGGYALLKYKDRESAFVNVFLQNGQYCYGGKPYSAAYLAQVTKYMQTRDGAAGAYIADSGYYRDLYYSIHNPVVYHLPITYIISNNVRSNMDYCVSDTAAIYCGTGMEQRDAYLANGIARSFFHNGFMPGSDMTDTGEKIRRFIDEAHLEYLVVTKDVRIDPVLLSRMSGSYTDENTGERFLIIQPTAR